MYLCVRQMLDVHTLVYVTTAAQVLVLSIK